MLGVVVENKKVILKDDAETYEESIETMNLQLACTQLFTNCSEQVKMLIINFEDREMTSSELQLVPQLLPPRWWN